MKIYIATDFEGVCCVAGEPEKPLLPGSSQYEFARRMLTAEVNAAIEGALAAGWVHRAAEGR